MFTPTIRFRFLVTFLSILIFSSCAENDPTKDNLKAALTFYSSFDKSADADFALGDKHLYTVPNRRARDSAQAGLHKPDIKHVTNQGKFGGALLFTDKSPGNIYYPSTKNIAYSTTDWSGAISFWLNLDPNTDLKPGYCDPIQITDVSYNDAAIWVDFTKDDSPRNFRLGVIGDRDSWNPNPEGPDNVNPNFIKQLPVVENPPFSKGKWTHVLINFSNLNTQKGKAELYVDGELKGTRSEITDPFTWELDKSNIYLGLSYIGLYDELSIYNKTLSKKEITTLYNLENGVQTFLK